MAIGGLIPKKTVNGNVSVSWEWYNKPQGLVKWNFVNNGNAVQSGILFRNDYPFGNAFWPIYVDNSADFGTSFTTMAIPLTNTGVENNTMPLAVYVNPDGSMFVAFLFTLAPSQAWSCLEGGFSDSLEPSGYRFIPAGKLSVDTFRIMWDASQCSGYNRQSGTNLPCPANPMTVSAALLKTYTDVRPLYNDYITTVGGKTKPSCAEMVVVGIATSNAGMIIQGLECAVGNLPNDWKKIIREQF